MILVVSLKSRAIVRHHTSLVTMPLLVLLHQKLISSYCVIMFFIFIFMRATAVAGDKWRSERNVLLTVVLAIANYRLLVLGSDA